MWISLSWTFSFIFYLFFNIQLKGIGFLKHSPALVELILGFSPIILLIYWVTVFDFQTITSFHSIYLHQFSSVQSLSRAQLFASPWITACQASLSITNSWNSLRLTSIESVMPSSQHHHSKASILHYHTWKTLLQSITQPGKPRPSSGKVSKGFAHSPSAQLTQCVRLTQDPDLRSCSPLFTKACKISPSVVITCVWNFPSPSPILHILGLKGLWIPEESGSWRDLLKTKQLHRTFLGPKLSGSRSSDWLQSLITPDYTWREIEDAELMQESLTTACLGNAQQTFVVGATGGK